MPDILVQRNGVTKPIPVPPGPGTGDTLNDKVLLQLKFLDTIGIACLLVPHKRTRLVESELEKRLLETPGFNFVLWGSNRRLSQKRFCSSAYSINSGTDAPKFHRFGSDGSEQSRC